MRHLPRDDYPIKCHLCDGEYRAPTLEDAIIGVVNCSGSCNSYHSIFEGDRREAIKNARVDILRAAGVVVKP